MPRVQRAARRSLAPGTADRHTELRDMVYVSGASPSSEFDMHSESRVSRCQVEIINALGLHLRPADKFAQLANSFEGTDIRVRHNGRDFNGKSILELAMLGAECGTRLELEASGPHAEAALAALAELVSSQFHESAEVEPAAQKESP
jgi:phosphotransferase system HPr (HPr) family protein